MLTASGAALLERLRGDVEPRMRAVTAELPAGLRQIGGYHLGWWDERMCMAWSLSGGAIAMQAVHSHTDRSWSRPRSG